MVILDGGSSENLIGPNHLLRDHEPWVSFLGIGNGLDDLHGLLRVDGSDNSVIGNHFSETIDTESIRPIQSTPVVIRLIAGISNYISSNHIVAMDVRPRLATPPSLPRSTRFSG